MRTCSYMLRKSSDANSFLSRLSWPVSETRCVLTFHLLRYLTQYRFAAVCAFLITRSADEQSSGRRRRASFAFASLRGLQPTASWL